MAVPAVIVSGLNFSGRWADHRGYLCSNGCLKIDSAIAAIKPTLSA
ncbi:hypothetical protein IQ256_25700 [cf. Phormidesmis sp. LEGE 11477]|nr:hypothetical protein [cf. Phormidesmis sp. LEGE 11477]